MLSTVHVLKDKSYVAIVNVTSGDVEAEFRVQLSPRRKRRSWSGKVYKHYMKPLEMLDDEAIQKIARFCERVSNDGSVAKK